jgi:pyrroloquinoline quinone (PQQ) biosynthesis protein C
MTQKKEITDVFNALVDQLLDRSAFFRFWEKGQAAPVVMERFLVSFDSLVKSFPSLIAQGASRMEDEQTRAVLAVNLYQECGEGNPDRTHHAIYRKFLSTAGIHETSASEPSFAIQWRESLREYLHQEGPGAVLGALAAGEFLAEPALSRLYPALKSQYPNADQEYFTKHLSLETEHVEEITNLLERQARIDGGTGEIEAGFRFGLGAWETYFNRLAEHLAESPAR